MSKLPLSGKNILVTRPGTAGKDFAAKLQLLGANAILMPLIEITDPDSWQELDKAVENISAYDWLIFASGNAVNAFAKRWEYAKQQLENLSKNNKVPKIAVVGETTAAIAKHQGFTVNYCPNNYLAEDFIAHFPGYPQLAGCNILWPRTNIGREIIAEKLSNAGAKINTVAAYKTNLPANAQELHRELIQLIAEKKIDVITLASKETAVNLYRIISLNLQSSGAPAHEIQTKTTKELCNTLQDILIVTIGPQTSEGALNYLGKTDLEASTHTTDGLITTLVNHYQTCWV